IVEDGDAHGLVVDGAGVVAPRRLLPAAFLLSFLAVGILDLAALRCLDQLIDAHGHRAFLGVAEGDRADAGVQVDVEHDEPGLAEVAKKNVPRIVKDLSILPGSPLVAATDQPNVPPLLLISLYGSRLSADDPTLALALRPEVHTLDALDLVFQLDAFGDDIAVAEPDRLVMGMVLGAVGCEDGAGWRLNRPENGSHHG